jgi:hypothetical protein
MVNRLWHHYFGRGLVATPNDFGVAGGNPSHPELLDYLATELVRGGWRLKAIHRLIVTSAAYRQASDTRLNLTAAKAEAADPDDKLLWHAHVRRRDGESVRDVMLQASGRLDLRLYGPSIRPELPAALRATRYGYDPDSAAEDRNRRSIYVFASRNMPFPLFAAFDQPDRYSSCPVRAVTTTAPQALVMLNGELALDQARNLADVLVTTHGKDVRRLVCGAYVRAFGRKPATDEVTAAEQFLTRQMRLARTNSGGSAPSSTAFPELAGSPTMRGSEKVAGEDRRGDAASPRGSPADPAYTAAVVDFCHALLNTAEFLYVD